MESRGLEDSKNVKTSQAYFFEGFISFFEDFSLTITQDNKTTSATYWLEQIHAETHSFLTLSDYGII